MKLDSRHILILLGLTSALSSCVQFSAQEGMAQLYPPVFEVDATVEDLAQTKAEPAKPVPVAPTYPEVHFTVKDKDGHEVYNKLGVWDAPLKLPIGAYSIEAYSGSNTFGSPYFTGTASGTVEVGKEETPKITMKLQNAYLAVGLTETLAPHFTATGNSIRISTASASIDTGLDTYVFVPSGEALNITISGTSSTGMPKTITHSLTARSAATATYLSCDLTTTNAPKITLDGTPQAWGKIGYIPVATTKNISEVNVAKMKYLASSDNWSTVVEGVVDGTGTLVKFTDLNPGIEYLVRAEIGALKSDEIKMTTSTSALSIKSAAVHTYTKSELDGTDFTASFNVPKEFGVTESSLQLCDSDGKVLRRVDHLTGTSADWTSDGSAITGDDIWPFLPGGKYILKGTATQNDSSIPLEEYQFTVPATPDFTVTVTGTTTYDLYSNGDIEAANEADAESITGIEYSVSGIAQRLKDNKNYSYKEELLLDNDDIKGRTSVSGQSWDSHTLIAKVTFASKEITAQKYCHITGLPYTAAPPTNTGSHPWSGNAKSWEGSFVRLHKGTITQTFHVPNDINLSVYHEARIYTRADNTKYTFYIGGDIAYTQEQSSFGGKETYDKTTYNKYKFTPSQKSIKCENTYGTIDAMLEYTNVKVYNITVKYRQ